MSLHCVHREQIDLMMSILYMKRPSKLHIVLNSPTQLISTTAWVKALWTAISPAWVKALWTPISPGYSHNSWGSLHANNVHTSKHAHNDNPFGNQSLTCKLRQNPLCRPAFTPLLQKHERGEHGAWNAPKHMCPRSHENRWYSKSQWRHGQVASGSCVSACMCGCVHMCMCVCVRMRACIHVHACVCLCVCVCLQLANVSVLSLHVCVYMCVSPIVVIARPCRLCILLR